MRRPVGRCFFLENQDLDSFRGGRCSRAVSFRPGNPEGIFLARRGQAAETVAEAVAAETVVAETVVAETGHEDRGRISGGVYPGSRTARAQAGPNGRQSIPADRSG